MYPIPILPSLPGVMPLPPADASPPSSFLLAKCGSTLFCLGRSVALWAVVVVVSLLGALWRRLSRAARLRAPGGAKQSFTVE